MKNGIKHNTFRKRSRDILLHNHRLCLSTLPQFNPSTYFQWSAKMKSQQKENILCLMNSAWGIIKINTHRIHILPFLAPAKHVICLWNRNENGDERPKHHHIDIDVNEYQAKEWNRLKLRERGRELKRNRKRKRENMWIRMKMVYWAVPWNHLFVYFAIQNNAVEQNKMVIAFEFTKMREDKEHKSTHFRSLCQKNKRNEKKGNCTRKKKKPTWNRFSGSFLLFSKTNAANVYDNTTRKISIYVYSSNFEFKLWNLSKRRTQEV